MEEPAARQDNLPTIASNTAFAMMARGRSAVPLAAPSYPEFPDKGIRLTAQMLSFNAKQKPRDLGMGFYKTNGNRYQLSFLYDCSIDSSLGVSLSYLDTDVKSLHNDFRVKNTVTGYEASADYDGFLMGKFPMRGSAFYGRADTKTDGHIMAGGFGVPTPLAWHEDRHRSTLYGFSGRIGVPLLYGDDIKFMPELGFHYAQLRSRSYDVAVANAAAPLRMPSQRSSTFTIPLTATVKRDFLHCWGLITPKITGGIVRELSDKAAAFNGYNGSAATRMYYDGPTGIASEPGYDKAAKWSWHVGVGVDVKTVGGWEVSADYRRNWSEKYGGNEFKLELARCF